MRSEAIERSTERYLAGNLLVTPRGVSCASIQYFFTLPASGYLASDNW